MNNLIKDFAKFLDEKGFEIANEAKLGQEPSGNYMFASQIFTNKQVLLPLLCKVALNIAEPSPLKYTVGNPTDANKLKNFLDGLKREALLEYQVSGTGLEFEIVLPKGEDKRKFFRSEWAEQCFRYIITRIVNEFCAEHGNLSHKIMQGVEIRRKGDKNLFTELDLVVQLEKRFYAFEVKSGPWVRILQWAERERAFVTTDGPFRVIVCTIHDNIPAPIFEPQLLMTIGGLEKRLKRLLRSDFEAR